MKKRSFFLLFFIFVISSIFFYGCGGGGPGSPGSDGSGNTGVILDASIQPTYNGEDTDSVDSFQNVCDDGPPPVYDILPIMELNLSYWHGLRTRIRPFSPVIFISKNIR